MRGYIFTSESVAEGHPDKVCDLVADSILDAHLAHDPYSGSLCRYGNVVAQIQLLSV